MVRPVGPTPRLVERFVCVLTTFELICSCQPVLTQAQCRFLKFSVESSIKYFNFKLICEDRDAIKHGQTYVVGKFVLCYTNLTVYVTNYRLGC